LVGTTPRNATPLPRHAAAAADACLPDISAPPLPSAVFRRHAAFCRRAIARLLLPPVAAMPWLSPRHYNTTYLLLRFSPLPAAAAFFQRHAQRRCRAVAPRCAFTPALLRAALMSPAVRATAMALCATFVAQPHAAVGATLRRGMPLRRHADVIAVWATFSGFTS